MLDFKGCSRDRRASRCHAGGSRLSFESRVNPSSLYIVEKMPSIASGSLLMIIASKLSREISRLTAFNQWNANYAASCMMSNKAMVENRETREAWDISIHPT